MTAAADETEWIKSKGLDPLFCRIWLLGELKIRWIADLLLDVGEIKSWKKNKHIISYIKINNFKKRNFKFQTKKIPLLVFISRLDCSAINSMLTIQTYSISDTPL